jgi:hypothetical protein
MKPPSISCMRCRAPLPVVAAGAGAQTMVCSRCALPADVLLFPALYRPDENRQASTRALSGDATCFNHPERQALSVCETCGRMLCGLCQIDFNTRTLCAACLHREHDAARRGGKGFDAQRFRYDHIAFVVTVISPLIWYVSFATAAYALYLTIRHWRTPVSLLPFSRWRFVVASLLAVCILAGWVIGIVLLIAR